MIVKKQEAVSPFRFTASVIGVTGFEPATKTSGKTHIRGKGGAKSGALGAQDAPIDPDLAMVVKRWTSLPEAVKQDVVAIVRAAGVDTVEG